MDSEVHSKWRSSSSKRQKRDRETTAVNQEKLLPGDQTSLTVVSSLPRFAHSDSSSVSVVVTWTSENMDRSTDRHSMHCGDVTLHFEQIINGSLNVNSGVDLKSTQHNIEAFRSVSVKTKVREIVHEGFKMSCCLVVINSLSINIDPHQTSPCSIIAQSNEQGKRVNGIISTDEMS